MNYAEGMKLAMLLARATKPYIHRGALAGSLRRAKQENVKDVELVLIPKWETRIDPSDMFGEKTVPVNLLHEWAMTPDCPVQWIKPGTPEIINWAPKADGKYWRGILKESGAKLDVFLANEQNWGAVLLIRTGAADFSQEVVTHALRVGYKFRDGHLWAGEQMIPVETEEDVFLRLGLKWIAPEERHDKAACVPMLKGFK